MQDFRVRRLDSIIRNDGVALLVLHCSRENALFYCRDICHQY